MAFMLKRFTGINPLTLYAPRISQRICLLDDSNFEKGR